MRARRSRQSPISCTASYWMIFSRMIAGVDQSIRRSTRKPRLNQEENRWTKIGVDRGEILAVVERVHQLFAHGDQRLGAARREVEAAKQLLPTRLGGTVQLDGGDCRRATAARPRRRARSACDRARSDAPAPREGDARAGVQLREAQQDIAGERGYRRASPRTETSSSHRSTRLSERSASAPRPAAGAVDKRPPALGDRLQQFAEERRIHRMSVHIG